MFGFNKTDILPSKNKCYYSCHTPMFQYLATKHMKTKVDY